MILKHACLQLLISDLSCLFILRFSIKLYSLIKSEPHVIINQATFMVKRDPDDIISAVSKNLKSENPQIMRITFKKGGEYGRQFAKAHSRVARKQLKIKIKKDASENPAEVWPLYVRYKQGVEGKQTKQNRFERTVLNCGIDVNKGNQFIHSLLGVFRVNFFKKKDEEGEKKVKNSTAKNPQSSTSLKKLAKRKRNQERRHKRKEVNRQKELRAKKEKLENSKQITSS